MDIQQALFLKILLTNFCIYDCFYCVNRSSSNTPRARLTFREVVRRGAAQRVARATKSFRAGG